MSIQARAGKLLAFTLVPMMVAAGCAGRPKHDQSSTTPGGGSTATTTQNPLAIPVNPPNPGPYKTVDFQGEEVKQGRFPQGQYGGTLIQAIIGSDPKTFNPWSASDTQSGLLSGMMFSGLTTLDTFTGDVIPELAAEIKTEPDNLTYTVRLRKGIKWSDGKPITSDDVVFTFNEIVAKGYGNSSIRDGLMVGGKFPECKAIDPLTVQFKTAKPFAPFLRSAGVAIAPKHVIAPIIANADGRKLFDQLWSATDQTTKKSLVTSGPYTLNAFVPAQRVELKRTNNYYYVDPSGQKRLPYLDRLVYLIIPDVNVNLLKFQGGETDLAPIRSKDASKVQSDASKLNCQLYNLGPMTSTTFVAFNMNQRKNAKGKPFVTPYKSAWFNDVNFRQAINHVLNRQRMIDNYLKGIGAPAWGCEPVISPFFFNELKAVNPDIQAAKDLLAKSGFKTGKNGMLQDKDGHPVEFTLLYGSGGTFNEAVSGYIQDDLKQLGIKLNPQAVDFNVLIDKVNGTKEWDTILFGLSGDPLDPNSGANVWRSDGRLHLFDEREADANGTIVVKDARPWEKRIDEIFDLGAQELDVAKRKNIYNEYQQIIYDQAPMIYLVTPMEIIAARNTIKNFVPTKLSQSSNGLHNIDEIWKEGSK